MPPKKKNITLKNIPDEIYTKLIQLKTEIMTRTKRSVVSYEEIIFKLIKAAK